ncbi:helix-turn-helix transcriptional regulator [uncultured Traorella sp.]|uniref:helix-turn-helix domain-containing protein n=1 Tax=uncultured Traorella sp. TaxID=1929048 RepID=UPI0025D0FBF4|nr:helix-turn-helix transcriptional regulator [uncultured Traorella sp.]
MLSENLKTIRKQKGLSQEELAIRLHVVRQTISKWEKGLSVPDSDMLIRLAEIFEVNVSDLLGEKIEDEEKGDALTEQLVRINEQMAVRNRRSKMILKAVAGVIAVFIVLNLLLILMNMVSFDSYHDSLDQQIEEIME